MNIKQSKCVLKSKYEQLIAICTNYTTFRPVFTQYKVFDIFGSRDGTGLRDWNFYAGLPRGTGVRGTGRDRGTEKIARDGTAGLRSVPRAHPYYIPYMIPRLRYYM